MNIFLLPFCAAIVYACFCRLLKTDATVKKSVRYGFVALAVSAVALAYTATILQAHFIDAALSMAGSILWVLIATSSSWRDGIPEHYQTRK